MSATATQAPNLAILNELSPEEADALYLQLVAQRKAAGKPVDPDRKTTRAGSSVQLLARANDHARATLANERTVTRLGVTSTAFRDALVASIGNTPGATLPEGDFEDVEEHISALLAVLPEDVRGKIETSMNDSREKMEAARIKIQDKLRGKNTQAMNRARAAQAANGSEPDQTAVVEEDESADEE